jgi:hypothetical protein
MGADTFDWQGFLDCIRRLARETSLSMSEFVKKLLATDHTMLSTWRTDTEVKLDVAVNQTSARSWDAKKVSSSKGLLTRSNENTVIHRFLLPSILCVMLLMKAVNYI